jgi:hypothetical protein
MTELPEPLTPPDCDLRNFPWMELDINRLLTSETWILGTAEECKACVTLWCEAWRQIPAASLPDDDRMLAHLSRAGAGWKKIKEGVMRSWIKCSDGRLYHPVVAEKAVEAWEKKLAQRNRTEAARLAKLNKKNGHIVSETPPTANVADNDTEAVTNSAAKSVTENVTGSRREERRGEEKKEESSGTSYRATAAPSPADPPDVRTEFWREGLAIVRGLTGKSDAVCRAFLGRALKVLADDCDAGMAILHHADDLRPGGPEAWIMASCEARMSRKSSGISARKEKILRAGGLWPELDGPIIDAHREGVWRQ